MLGNCLYNYIIYVIYLLKSILSKPALLNTITNQVSSFHIIRNIHSSRGSFNNQLTEDDLREGCRLGIDSHADVSCVGKHARITEVFQGKAYNVQPFNDLYKPMKDIRTVNAAFSHDTTDGRSYVLHINQSLDFTNSMEHSLLCPNQARINGLIVDDVPRHLDWTNNSSHSIIVP